MITLSNQEIDKIIEEDIPLIDLTTEFLDIKGEGVIRFFSRQESVVCGTEEIIQIFRRLGIKEEKYVLSGSVVEKGDLILSGHGDIRELHKAWKISLNILEYLSGIATHTREFVDKAKAVNPYVTVATTRKYMPFTKKLVMKAIMTGGAVPHRMSLSDTFLVFKQHMVFKSFEEILKELQSIRKKLGNKQVGIEVDTEQEAKMAIDAGFDFVQLDKWKIEDIVKIVDYRNKNNPNTSIAVAGGININNVQQFAQTGIDIIVTTSLYWSKPADIKAVIERA